MKGRERSGVIPCSVPSLGAWVKGPMEGPLEEEPACMWDGTLVLDTLALRNSQGRWRDQWAFRFMTLKFRDEV